MPLWRDYRAQLRPNPAAGGYRNLVDPRGWFSVDALPGRGYEQWAYTLAGVFLTVGLLFTFVGLSAVLLKIVDAGGDPSKLWKAVMGILNVNSAKFITSISGLIASASAWSPGTGRVNSKR